MKKKKKWLINTFVYSGLFLGGLSISTDTYASTVASPSTAQTEVSVKFHRPIRPTVQKPECQDSIIIHEIDAQKVIQKGFLPQTGNVQNLFLPLIGYLMIILSSIIYFKRRTLNNG